MNNFNYQASTHIYFGRDQIKNLPAELLTYGKKVLLTYGGGSIKKNGLYDKIYDLLKDFDITELSGIEPNPRLQTVEKGAKICKEKDIEIILAVGGGSTMDCSKAIAAAACYDGKAWDLVQNPEMIQKALPVITITTMAATGSEADMFGVITNLETNEKLGMGSPLLMPKVAIMDPTYTFTVPENQTIAGIADMMSHIMEVYFTKDNAYLSDRICEAALKTCIQYAPIVKENPEDYDARAEILWANTIAMNGVCSAGKVASWSCHPMEHELSAYYDITHGVGLAIITPQWMRYILSEETVDKFVEYAKNVWNIEGEDKYQVANEGIKALEDFFVSLNIPMHLSDLNITDEYFKVMAKHAVEVGGLKDAYVELKPDDVYQILKMCL